MFEVVEKRDRDVICIDIARFKVNYIKSITEYILLT